MPVGRILLISEKKELASDDPTSSVLRNAGYEVLKISFFNGSLDPPDKNEGIHAVLIDLTKAVIDGDGMLDEVEKRYPDAPVAVLISDRNSPMVLPKLRQSAYEFLPKPFQSEQLLAMVARAIEHRNLKCEIRNLGREMTAIQRRAESEAQDKLEKMRHCLGDLELSFDLTLEVCCEAIDLKEPAPHGHSKRVTAFTIAIARAMGLDKEPIRVIARGAFLHDIGMLALTDAILQKPTALTASETTAMREHCFRGYQLLRKIPFLVEASEIVYSHHEFYDGTGYPRGLKGDNIPLGSRIFAVADALDAITSQRPYRTERPIEVAKTEIERWRRRQFDPNLVDVFLRMPESIWVDLRREISRQGADFGID